MKKFIKTLLVALFVIPCALFFSACGNDDENTYDRAANEAKFDSSMEVVSELGSNFTVTATATTTGIFDTEQQFYESSIPSTFSIKFDDGNLAINVADLI